MVCRPEPYEVATTGMAEFTVMPMSPKAATGHTRARNAAVHAELDPADFERASRGLIAQHPTGRIDSAFGVAWDVHRFDFIEQGGPAPDTVNPSLWRQAQLNSIHGLFEIQNFHAVAGLACHGSDRSRRCFGG